MGLVQRGKRARRGSRELTTGLHQLCGYGLDGPALADLVQLALVLALQSSKRSCGRFVHSDLAFLSSKSLESLAALAALVGSVGSATGPTPRRWTPRAPLAIPRRRRVWQPPNGKFHQAVVKDPQRCKAVKL